MPENVDALIPYVADMARAMIFIDGENLAIRYGELLRAGRKPWVENRGSPGIYIWAWPLSSHKIGRTAILRRHYYTAVQGDSPMLSAVESELKKLGIEAPRVFKKEKGRPTKRVDITLTTEMLIHATRKHYEIAVLVAGDEDYVPLVRAVQAEGALVHVWFVSSGLAPALAHAADLFVDFDRFLFE